MSKLNALTVALAAIAVQVGEYVLHFALDDADINRFLNEQQPNEKIKGAFNLLSRTVIEEDREVFKRLALASDGITPRGAVVMQIAMLVVSEFGGDLEISIKKPNSLPTESNATATTN